VGDIKTKVDDRNQKVLDEVSQDIIRDAQDNPEQYLNDCLVLEGGE